MEVVTLSVLATATAACVAAYMIWFYRMTARLSGPRVWPLVGCLPGHLDNAERLHDWISDNLCKTGGTYQTCLLALPFLARRQGLVTATCDPRNLEHILKTRFDNYCKGPAWQAIFHDLLGGGIFNSDGDAWLFQRKTAAPEFSTRTLRLAMSRWVSLSIHKGLLPILDTAVADGSTVDLQDLLLRLTFDNICGLTFGQDPQTLDASLPENHFARSFDRATEATLHRFLLPKLYWRLMKLFRLGMEGILSSSVTNVYSYLFAVINARKLELSSTSLHDDLLSRFQRNGAGYSDDFLQQVAVNFILAGRDTTSVALSWFFWAVATHPEVEHAIIHELYSVLAASRGDQDRKAAWFEAPLDYEELDRLVYLKATLSETLRLYPSVPENTKYVVADDLLPDGTFVPAGSSITYSIYSVGRMESVWGQDCLEFRPERWISEDLRRFEPPADSFKFMAFNAGPRLCLGKDLAYLQMKSIAAAVLLRCRFELEPGHRVEQKISLMLFLKHGLRMYVRRRDPVVEGCQTGLAFDTIESRQCS
ncbi:hypothetical protein KFK09_023829 [Dendrobium nobile]|uniref:noroxomaritidine synthase n=1 Tax=Dendrobium nobile TaxID=94219 RepID=A0A8T3AHJ2_DENNO|nr:hypothetical protein KFK09_023829 [Dendrobium nobile]